MVECCHVSLRLSSVVGVPELVSCVLEAEVARCWSFVGRPYISIVLVLFCNISSLVV